MRRDRVDFPPGGIAYRHTHPGPGIRYLLHGSIRIDSAGETHEYGPGEPWFESGPEPVLATASETEDTAFVRVLLLPGEWAGKRTIRYVHPADDERPKLQRATVFLEQPVGRDAAPRRASSSTSCVVHGVDTGLLRPGRELPRRPRRDRRHADQARHGPPRGGRGEHGRGVRQADRPARGSASSRARPGATHAAVGIHTAYQDSTPLVVLVGQVPRRHLGREAFQELDYARMFGEMAKWVAVVEDAAALPELVSHAFHTATSGRPGPVVIALPEDVQADEADVADAAPYRPAQASPATGGRRAGARARRARRSGRCSSSAAAAGASRPAAT